MNKDHNTVDDFPMKCNTSKNLDFEFTGHVIMGVARYVILGLGLS